MSGSEPAPARQTGASHALDIALGRVATLLLASIALILGIATFAILAGRVKLGGHSSVAVGMSVADFAALLLLIIVLVVRVTRVVLERRRGAAGRRIASAPRAANRRLGWSRAWPSVCPPDRPVGHNTPGRRRCRTA